MAFSEPPQKKFRSSFVLILSLSCRWKYYPSRGFLRYTCKRDIAFPKQIPGSLDHLTGLTPCWQGKR